MKASALRLRFLLPHGRQSEGQEYNRTTLFFSFCLSACVHVFFFCLSSTLTISFFPFRSADAWLSAAVDCLEFLPDQLVVEVSRGLAKCPEETAQYKRLLYSVLIQHYGQTDYPPLFSNHVFDIHSGISELLGKTGRGMSICLSFYEMGALLKKRKKRALGKRVGSEGNRHDTGTCVLIDTTHAADLCYFILLSDPVWCSE